MQRMKWMMTDPGDNKDQMDISNFLKSLAKFKGSEDREALTSLLTSIENTENSEVQSSLGYDISGLSESAVAMLSRSQKHSKSA